MTLEGIDVASFQGYIHWDKVKADGKVFGICKATEGAAYLDPSFPHNWASMAYRGIIRGAYHYLRPDIDGVTQADFFHEYVRNSGRFRVGDFAMLDMEEVDGISTLGVLECAENFVQRILSTTQCGVFIYTGAWFWDGLLGSPESTTLARCPLVLSSYGPPPGVLSNWPSGASIWQYSDKGHVPGIIGDVDLDRFLGTLQELHILAREGGRH